MNPVVIIGSGLAGYTLAKEFRKLSAEKITVITGDDGAFYSKPMLSNAITKKKTAQELVNFTAEAMADQHNLQILTNTLVDSINTGEKKLTTQQGEKILYSKLVFAVGANPVKAFKEDSKNIFSVNNLQDYAAFRDAIQDKERIAIIGAGLIGCEFANDLIDNGYMVDVIAPGNSPLSSLLPDLVADKLRTTLQTKGVHWHLQNKVDSLRTDKDKIQLTLTNGDVLESDVALSAIGLQANVAIAKKTGLKTNRGIIVDNFCRSSDSHIYALGDCAEMNGKVLPFVMPIMTAARALAKTLAGQPDSVKYPLMPVILKTPACPIVVCPSADTVNGQWQYEEDNEGITARYLDEQEQLRGFCVAQNHVAQKQALLKAMLE